MIEIGGIPAEASGSAFEPMSPRQPLLAARTLSVRQRRKPKPSGVDLMMSVTQSCSVDAAPPSVRESREADPSEVDPFTSVPTDQVQVVDLAPLVDEMREQWRQRQAWHRAEKALTLQAKALCRRLAAGDKGEAEAIYKAAYGKGSHPMGDVAFAATFPLTEARDGIAKHRAAVEKRLVKLAKDLPVASFVVGTRGVGLLSLAAIVGEVGDLSGYSNPAKLWKRLGLAVMSDGTRQRRVAGVDALTHGYSPARRSVVWNIGACIVKAGGPLKAVYDARKVYEAERVETKAHAHNRAQRYVEKRFVRELWSAWRSTAQQG